VKRDANAPKFLLIDVETFPMLYYAWRPYDTGSLKTVEDTSMASFTAKWYGERGFITRSLADYKGYKAGSRDDKALLAELWTLLDEADWVAAHNGDRFDVKIINYRFMVHGMPPPSPYEQIDTLKEVKKVARHDSNRLNELCRVHGIGQKVRTGGKDLWFDCLGGDVKAWARMKRYNEHDVRLLEGLYNMLMPWMKKHPNRSNHTGIASCPKCGSTKIQKRGKARSRTRTYDRLQCQGCGAWARSVASDKEGASVVNL
jgi:predicted RNA-binding Zn-ribbon protein involved in translation (DUF1610 family)